MQGASTHTAGREMDGGVDAMAPEDGYRDSCANNETESEPIH